MTGSKDSKQSIPQDVTGSGTLIERRRFLQQGALAGAAALVSPPGVAATQAPAAAPAGAPPAQTAPPPVMTQAAEATPPGDVQVMGDNERSGSDFMVDVFKSLDFDYICANPGSSFRACTNRSSTTAAIRAPSSSPACTKSRLSRWRTRYFKAEGKPLAVMAHGTVGLQHASMALYNAWCDRVPVYMILGNHGDAAMRRGAEWYHGVQDAARDGPRLHEVGRHPVVAHAFRRISRTRVQDRADAADGARRASCSTAGCRSTRSSKSDRLSIPKLTLPVAAAGRNSRRRRSRTDARRRPVSAARGRSSGAHTQRHERCSSSWPKRCRPA